MKEAGSDRGRRGSRDLTTCSNGPGEQIQVKRRTTAFGNRQLTLTGSGIDAIRLGNVNPADLPSLNLIVHWPFFPKRPSTYLGEGFSLGCRRRLAQVLKHFLLSIFKDPVQVWPDEESIDKPSPHGSILHTITDQGTAVAFFKRMQIPPQSVRAPQLSINKPELKFLLE